MLQLYDNFWYNVTEMSVKWLIIIGMGLIGGIVLCMILRSSSAASEQEAESESVRNRQIRDAGRKVASQKDDPVKQPSQSAPKKDAKHPKGAMSSDEFKRYQVEQPSATKATVETMTGLFAQIRKDLEAGNASKSLIALSHYRPDVVLTVARQTMRFGTPQDKQDALASIGALFSREKTSAADRALVNEPRTEKDEVGSETHRVAGQTGEKAGDAGGDAGAESAGGTESADGSRAAEPQVNEREQLTHDLVDVVSAGLEDGDRTTREQAAATILDLPDEEYGVLSSQLVSGDDVALKVSYLGEAAEGGEKRNVATMLQALGDGNSEVRTAATEGLRKLTGQTFTTQEAAAEWWNANSQNFGEQPKTRND